MTWFKLQNLFLNYCLNTVISFDSFIEICNTVINENKGDKDADNLSELLDYAEILPSQFTINEALEILIDHYNKNN